MKERRTRIYDLYTNTRDKRYLMQLRHLRNQFKKLEKLAKNRYEYRMRQKLIDKFYGSKNFFWKEIKSREDKTQNVEVDKDELVDYYSSLFNVAHDGANRDEQNKLNEEMYRELKNFESKKENHKVDENLVFTILGKLKNNKKTGL